MSQNSMSSKAPKLPFEMAATLQNRPLCLSLLQPTQPHPCPLQEYDTSVPLLICMPSIMVEREQYQTGDFMYLFIMSCQKCFTFEQPAKTLNNVF